MKACGEQSIPVKNKKGFQYRGQSKWRKLEEINRGEEFDFESRSSVGRPPED